LLNYEIKLLSPLFYGTKPDSGAAGANTTGSWIGDLAVSYAINASLGILKSLHFDYTGRGEPNYKELFDLPFITSVAMPLEDPSFTQVYDTATSFISQGYFNFRAFQKTGNAPMRNWLKKQGLSPGNRFSLSIATKGGWEPPEKFTVRLGNMKETLAQLTRINRLSNEITINLYTLWLLLNKRQGDSSPNISKIIEKLSPFRDEYQSAIEYVMPQYILFRKVKSESWLSLLEEYA